jgi:opacity protein-like surface antigen
MDYIRGKSLSAVKLVLYNTAFLSFIWLMLASYSYAAGYKTSVQYGYIRADAGYSYPFKKFSDNTYSKKLKASVIGAIGAGCAINSKFRTDITAVYRGDYKYSFTTTRDTTRVDERQKISSVAFMWSGYWSPFTKGFGIATPYLIGGVGLSINKAGDFLSSPDQGRVPGDQKRNFAWQIGAGSLLKINDSLAADIMYKYVDLGRLQTKGFMITNPGPLADMPACINGKIRTHEITIGMHYKF